MDKDGMPMRLTMFDFYPGRVDQNIPGSAQLHAAVVSAAPGFRLAIKKTYSLIK
jgi:hypothetical protein